MHPCPLLHSSLLVQKNVLLRCLSMTFCSWLENSSISLSSLSDVGAYACTIVMLKGTALRQMVISLAETRRQPMTVFTMSNAMLVFILNSTEGNLVSFLCCYLTKVLPSHFTVQGCSICTCPFRVSVPGVSQQLLVSLCSMCQW